MTKKYLKQIDFELSEPIEYSFNGQLPKTNKLVLKAPKIKHYEAGNFVDVYNPTKLLKFLTENQLIVTKENSVELHSQLFQELDYRDAEGMFRAYLKAFLQDEEEEDSDKKKETQTA